MTEAIVARKASVETGIELSADGVRQVGAEFSKLGRNVVQSAEQIRKITDFVRNFKEIGRAAFDVAREALTRLLDVTLEYRDANDAQVKELTKAANSVKVLASRIGDALIPVIQGLSRALGPVITETTKWLEANREWLALEIVENMAALAETHRHDCPAMGQALSSFVEENRLEYEELNARIFERGREGRAQCEQDERSAMCENYHIHVWNTAEFLIRGRVADDKLKFYGNWCVQDEQVREALITWQKVMSEARQRRHETEGK
ncbi:MAG: hypothetical protein KKC50_08250 [Candidatus Omnitrophica bacterium]|nr:hypothetical protein [Candidatus Omnitrophota bacterium]